MTRIIFQNAQGRPLAGAVLAITAAPAEMTDLGYITDEQGGVTLTLPAAGHYAFVLTDGAGEQISARGELPASGEITLTAGDV